MLIAALIVWLTLLLLALALCRAAASADGRYLLLSTRYPSRTATPRYPADSPSRAPTLAGGPLPARGSTRGGLPPGRGFARGPRVQARSARGRSLS
jgi:hypothetical protein